MSNFAENMLEYLIKVANGNLMVNGAIHIVVLLGFVGLYAMKSEKARSYIMKGMLVLLLSSAAAHVIVYGNPVHFATFGILAVMAFIQLFNGRTLRLSDHPMHVFMSAVFMFLGFWYPKFVEVNALESLLYSPLGVVPCATLLMTLGLISACCSSVNQSLYMVTVAAAIFYGMIGVFLFKVYFDIALLALALFAIAHLIGIIRNPKIAMMSH